VSRTRSKIMTSPFAVLLAIAGVVAGGTSASASTPSVHAHPHAVICSPASGTVLTSKATSDKGAWIATSLSSAYVAGPGTIARTVSASTTVSTQVSASFAIKESLLFASAEETYGIQLGASLTHSATWSYSLNVPSGHTDKAQQYHAGYELGVKQTYVGSSAQHCAAQTETSATGDFFPTTATADSSYCFATISYNNPPPMVGKCINRP
jgi:hypothetical protein